MQNEEYLESRILICLQCSLCVNKGAMIPLYCKQYDMDNKEIIKQNLCWRHDHLED